MQSQLTAVHRVPLRGPGSTIRGYVEVDAEDYERLAARRWHMVASKGNTYARRYDGTDPLTGKQRYVWMHREILDVGDFDGTVEIDHEDGNGLNNRRSNLIVSDRKSNAQNRRKLQTNTSSKYRGVCWVKAMNRWRAHVKVSGKRIYLGHYTDEEEANRAARAGRAKYLPHSTN